MTVSRDEGIILLHRQLRYLLEEVHSSANINYHFLGIATPHKGRYPKHCPATICKETIRLLRHTEIMGTPSREYSTRRRDREYAKAMQPTRKEFLDDGN